MRRSSESEAIEVLKMLASGGMNRAGKSLLDRAMTWSGGQAGLELCVRAPGPEEIATIRFRALSEELPADPGTSGHPLLQRLCTEALAYLGDYEGVAESVVQLGLHLPPDLVYYLDDRRQAPELLEVAERELEGRPIKPGTILLLGLHGGETALELLHGCVSESLGTDPDLELAWIVALDWTRDCAPRTLEVFRQHLNSRAGGVFVESWRGLMRRRDSPEAQAALLAFANSERGESPRYAGSMLDDDILRLPVAERLWAQRDDREFLLHFGDQLDKFAVLGTDEVRLFLLELATESSAYAPGARASAIRGLAEFDQEAAFRATLTLRQEEKLHHGTEWPDLMVEIGDSEALQHLRTDTAEVPDFTRLFVLGEALRKHKYAAVLQDWLEDQDPSVRERACHAACAQAHDVALAKALRKCCVDPAEDVRTAAQKALDYLRKDQEVASLIEELRSEPDSGRRWALIDSALMIGYPGVRAGFGQVSWFCDLLRDRPYYERKYCTGKLEKRREQLMKDLEKRSKNLREA